MADQSSAVKHTPGGEMPDTSARGRLEERVEADLPLLSDPVVQRQIALFLGGVALAIGAGIFFLKSRKA
jgi:hypothetical protein